MNTTEDPKGTKYPTELQAILDAYAPPADLIEMPLPGRTEVWKLRPITTTEQRRQLDQDIDKDIDSIPKDRSLKAFTKRFGSGFVPTAEEDLRLSYELHRRCVDPAIPVEFALELHRCPDFMAYVDRFLSQADRTMLSMLQRQALEAAKGKSERQAPSSNEDSRSAGDTSQDESQAT